MRWIAILKGKLAEVALNLRPSPAFYHAVLKHVLSPKNMYLHLRLMATA